MENIDIGEKVIPNFYLTLFLIFKALRPCDTMSHRRQTIKPSELQHDQDLKFL
jgi:hypothetical protein